MKQLHVTRIGIVVAAFSFAAAIAAIPACSFDDGALENLRCEGTADCADPAASCVSGYCVAAGVTDSGIDAGPGVDSGPPVDSGPGTDMNVPTDSGPLPVDAGPGTDMNVVGTDSMVMGTDSAVAMCTMSSNCTDPTTPVCPSGTCEPCTADPGECANIDPMRPLCRSSDGMCVECNNNGDCPGGGNNCLPDGTCSG